MGVLVVLGLVVSSAAADKPKPPAGKHAAKQPPAEPAPAADDGSAAAPTAAEVEASLPPHLSGPRLVELGHNTEIDLPAGMILLEKAEAQKMLQKGGDSADNAVAVVGKLDADWLVVIEYDGVGYVDDSDAKDLDAAELLKTYQDGTVQQNARRKTMGVPELFLDGWSELPRYEKSVHNLVWGLKAHSSTGQVINFFTRILGRTGYLSVNLIDAPDKIEKSKLEALQILTATRFKTGDKYEDHKDGDKSSGIGLRALVLGGAGIAVLKVAKVGLFAKFFLPILLALKKGIILIVAGIGGFFRWLFGKKKKDAAAAPPLPDDAPPAPPPQDPPTTV